LNEFARARARCPRSAASAASTSSRTSRSRRGDGFKLPDSIEAAHGGHYVDVDIYGTINFHPNIGVKGAIGSLRHGYLVKQGPGTLR